LPDVRFRSSLLSAAAPTEIYTLSLHDALPISAAWILRSAGVRQALAYVAPGAIVWAGLLATGIHPTIAGVVLGLITPVRSWFGRSEEHTSELQSRENLVCRLLLEKKNKRTNMV